MVESYNFFMQPLVNIPRLNEEEDWRRTSIFQTHVACQGRLCTLIINGGSCSNLASEELVENAYLLELPSNLHFSPIFNVEDLYIYHGHHNDVSEELDLQLPPTLSPRPEIEYVLDDQLVSTRQGGYTKFFMH